MSSNKVKFCLGQISLSSTTNSSAVSSSTAGVPAAVPTNQDNDATDDRKPALEPSGTEELLWEEMKLKYQFEELLNLKVLNNFPSVLPLSLHSHNE